MELDVTTAMNQYGSLGPDFLTWLLVRVLKDDMVPPPSEPALTLDIKGPLAFAADGGEATKVTMAGDEAASAPEVFSALRQGKRLHRAKVEIHVGESNWTFTLDASTFDIKSAKLPVPNQIDLDSFLSLRVESIMALHHYIDEIYDMFLPYRLDPEAWKAEVSSWRQLAKELGTTG
ncbi:MAG: hypothetical protein JJU11_07810 [Candidatus Sumerlaeia bacterium]|nr:hypothetical protein [Candidatus Sumerlaeia bacterium]